MLCKHEMWPCCKWMDKLDWKYGELKLAGPFLLCMKGARTIICSVDG